MESNLLASCTAAEVYQPSQEPIILFQGIPLIPISIYSIDGYCLTDLLAPFFFHFLSNLPQYLFLSLRICIANTEINSEHISKIMEEKIFCTSSLEKSQWIKAALSFFRLGLRPK